MALQQPRLIMYLLMEVILIIIYLNMVYFTGIANGSLSPLDVCADQQNAASIAANSLLSAAAVLRNNTSVDEQNAHSPDSVNTAPTVASSSQNSRYRDHQGGINLTESEMVNIF